jgi:hypothetical protein
MRVLLDEDTPVQLIAVLRHLLPAHHVDHVDGIKWKSKKDRNVLPDAKKAGYHVIVTKDRRQLEDPVECDAIKKAGLHHVRYTHRRKNLEGLGLAIGAVVAAMPQVMAALEEVDAQQLIRIAGINNTDRFDMTDPRRKPPSKYWPR